MSTKIEGVVLTTDIVDFAIELQRIERTIEEQEEHLNFLYERRKFFQERIARMIALGGEPSGTKH